MHHPTAPEQRVPPSPPFPLPYFPPQIWKSVRALTQTRALGPDPNHDQVLPQARQEATR